MATLPPTIGPYEVRERLGAGGMGSVYLGYDPQLGRPVAIKVLNEDLDQELARERFTREAHYAGRLRHRNIITIFGFGDAGGRPYIVMEYLPGETLADLITRRAALSLGAKLRIMSDVCAGVGHAHRMGILHRDVKPANVMVDADGTVKILDFGIARHAESDYTKTGTVLGTLNYLSPEQLQGRPLDARSDIFAVGALFYELVSYTRAFPGGIDDGVLSKVLNGDFVPLGVVSPGVPADVDACVRRALAVQPADRFQNLDAFGAEIASLQGRAGGDPQDITRELTVIVTPRSFHVAAPAGVVDPEAETTIEARAERVRTLIGDAERHLASGRFQDAVDASARALALDAAAADAVAILERGRTAMREARASSAPVVPRSRRARWVWAAAVLAVSGTAVTGLLVRQRLESSATSPPATSEAGPAVQPQTPSARPPDAALSAPAGAAQPSTLPGGNEQLSKALQAYGAGDREGALTTIEAVLHANARDTIAQSLLQTWITTARADSQSARQLADQSGTAVTASPAYRDARAKETDADQLLSKRPVDAVRAMWTAASLYRSALSSGSRVGAPPPAPAPAPPPSLASDVSSSPALTGGRGAVALLPAPGPPANPVANAAASSAATAPPAGAPAAAPALAIPAGVLDALNKYAAAHRQHDLKALKAAWPTLPKEKETLLDNEFKKVCKANEVRFADMRALEVNADSAIVTTTTTYVCVPATAKEQAEVVDDIFKLRRRGTVWIIDSVR